MPFQQTNLTMIAAGGTSQAPDMFSYQSSTDSIVDIMVSGYFSYTTQYPTPLGLMQLMKTGDVINVVDKNGMSFNLTAINTNNVITLSSNNLVCYQELLDCNGVGTAQVFDRPIAGYVLKADATLNGVPSTSSTPTIYLGKGLSNPIASFLVNPNNLQTNYDFNFTSTDRVFNGNAADVTQLMRMFAVITGTTANFNFKYNIYIIPAVQ